MGKLSCYVLNNVLYGEGLHNYYGMTRKGWYFMNKHVYETIRLHLMYSFEDRNDEGYSINDLIWYFENMNRGYPFVLKILKQILQEEFEGYTPHTISRGMITYLMGIDPKRINTWNFQKNGSFNKRYYCKKAKKVFKDFELSLKNKED